MTEAKLGGVCGKGLGGPVLRTFFNLAREWSLTEQQQMTLLGLTSRSSFQNCEAGGVSEVSRDTLERISCLLGIYKAINILFAGSGTRQCLDAGSKQRASFWWTASPRPNGIRQSERSHPGPPIS